MKQYRKINQDGTISSYVDVTVHFFNVADSEDPDLYAAEPLWKWEQSEAGQYVIEKAVEIPTYHQQFDVSTYGYKYVVVAKLLESDYIFFKLKYL